MARKREREREASRKGEREMGTGEREGERGKRGGAIEMVERPARLAFLDCRAAR